jgi:hypothetical protein
MKSRALVILLLLFARTAHAQTDTASYSTRAPSWVAQFTALSANAVLSGLTAGLFREIRGGSFQDGFTRGAMGGAIIYSGKRVAVERFTGAGLVGREIAAVGASVVRNASDGIGSFDRLILPASVTRIYWNRAAREIAVKLDAVAAGYAIYGITEKHLELDTRKSLCSGTFVFKTDNEIIITRGGATHAAGISRAGLVLLADVPAWGTDFLERAFAHERVHVLQDDQLFITLNDHADDWAFSKLHARRVSRYVDINVTTEALRLLSRAIPRHADRPWEIEAIYLTR